MPVRHAEPERDEIGPYNRLSASQANAYRACPRLWFYEKVYRFKMPQIPVLFVGRAVEEALCRVLRDSPSLVASSAPSDALGPSPYQEDGTPELSTNAQWPAPGLMPLLPHERPSTMDALEAWGLERCRVHLPVTLEKAKLAWEKDERKAGQWDEVDQTACLEMVMNGLRFHLKEVKTCYEAGGGPLLPSWRTGTRPDWPAPDGYAYPSLARGHPLAERGEVTWAEAWELARPWFVDPDAPPFTMNAIHPDHWFQGEYDLVYRWSGKTVIVDIKASVGATDRSGDYVEQMQAYAMLWYVTHDRQEVVDGLEIWYLGHPSIKSIPVPSVDDLVHLEQTLEVMWQELRQTTPNLDACPPSPRPLRGFDPGGVPSDAPDGLRCDRCDWRSVCPGGQRTEPLVFPSACQLPGATQTTPLQKIGPLDPRLTVRGELSEVGFASENRPRMLTLKQGVHAAQIQVIAKEHSDGGATLALEPKRGQSVILHDAVFTINWKGEIVLKMDPFSRLEEDTDPSVESGDLFDKQAKHNVCGIVVYAYEKHGVGKGGKRWSRKGIMVMDDTGAMKIEGWADDWNPQYDLAEVGDTVVLANIGLDAWAREVRGDYTRNSRLQIIDRVDRSTA